MERIIKYINRVYRASLADRSKFLEPFGLASHHLSYLLLLIREPGITQDNVASHLYVNKSSVTRVIKDLSEKGYLTKEINIKDSRSYCLFPTDKTKKLHPILIDYLEQYNEKLLSNISETSYPELVSLLRQLAINATSISPKEVFND